MALKRLLMVMVMFLFCFVFVSPCLAKRVGSKIMTQVQALMEQHNKAFNAQDLKGVMTTYATGPDVVLMGTGPGEAYVGDQAIGGAYNKFFALFAANSLRFKYDWIHVGSSGKVAWFAVTTTIEGTVKKEKRKLAFNMSGTLRKQKGRWRFVSMHFSRLGAGLHRTAGPQKSNGAIPAQHN